MITLVSRYYLIYPAPSSTIQMGEECSPILFSTPEGKHVFPVRYENGKLPRHLLPEKFPNPRSLMDAVQRYTCAIATHSSSRKRLYYSDIYSDIPRCSGIFTRASELSRRRSSTPSSEDLLGPSGLSPARHVPSVWMARA